jgi:predicted dehydrogenase
VNAPRIGILGARRHRQGLGPFVARWLREAGAEVPCFSCTSEETVAQAGADLTRIAGVTAKGWVDGEAMLREESLDAVAILTPPRTHGMWLEHALEAGLDVLCEKPFLWGAEDDLETACQLVDRFEQRGLLLMENTQWPSTLPYFDALHPGAREDPITRFAMRMAPASTGVDMIGDALPHPLSVLQALVPSEVVHVENCRFSTHDSNATELSIGFRYLADGHPIEVMVELSTSPEQPREASLAINGHWAHRLIRTADYAFFFASGARLVGVPDPLGLHLTEFVDALRSERPRASDTKNTRIKQRMAALDAVRRNYQAPPQRNATRTTP